MNYILSLNIRGMGDPSKMLRLEELIKDSRPGMVFLQENLCDRSKAINSVLSICKGWLAAGIHAIRHAGGLVA